jgi:transitional endoplasmic reticulum ATPase
MSKSKIIPDQTEVLSEGTRVLGRYRIISPVGAGAFGQVYKAHDEKLNRSCALKVFRRDVPGLDKATFEDIRQRSEKEARIGAKLNHPNVVLVYDIGEEEGSLILVMEYVGGGSLADRIRTCRDSEAPIPVEESIKVAFGIAKGLSALHKRDIVHRDLSPKNILLDNEGQAKIADLGLAQTSEGHSMRSMMSQVSVHPGTRGYRSPEHDSSADYLPYASDVYALGLLWFEMLTSRPYKRERPGTRVRKSRKDVPKWVDDLIAEMLQEDPEKRPCDGEELVKRILQGHEQEEREKGARRTRQPTTRERRRKPKRPVRVRAEPGAEEEAGVEMPSVAPKSQDETPRHPRTLDSALNLANPEHAALLHLVDERIRDEAPEWVDQYLFDAVGNLPKWLSSDTPAAWLRGFFNHADTEVAVSAVECGFLADDPEWFLELSTRFEAGIARVFILHGNIHDYVFHPRMGYLPLEQYLLEQYQGQQAVYQYSLTRGLRQCWGEVEEDAESGPPQQDAHNLWLRARSDMERLDQIVRDPSVTGVTVIIEHLNRLFPAQTSELEREFFLEMILRWAVSPDVLSSHNQVIMITPSIEDIHQDLRNSYNKIDLIEVQRPDNAARRKFLTALYASQNYGLPHRGRSQEYFRPASFGSGFSRDSTVDAVKQLSNVSSGLNRMGLEDLFLRSQLESSGVITRDYVVRHKKNLLATESAGLLEVVEPRFGFEHVGGLRLIRDRLESICEALHSPDDLVRQTVPMGILFLGPPGTGKTLVAEALAKESGLNFVKLGNIRAMWVGQSERNLSTALKLIAAMEPVIVFIDEIDQSEGQRSEGGDSGVSGRIFSKLMEFVGDTDHRGRILWIGASNAPSKIDYAMKRAGRFDLKLPFFVPEREDRHHIFKVILDSREIPYDPGLDFDWLADETEFFSGAEIEVVINEALRLAVDRTKGQQLTVSRDDFSRALSSYQPSTDPEEVKDIERAILDDIPFREFWPERYKQELGNDEG